MHIPDGFSGGALDFAGSPMSWVIYQLTYNLKWIGSGALVLLSMGLMWWNRVRIIRNQKLMIANKSSEIQSPE